MEHWFWIIKFLFFSFKISICAFTRVRSHSNALHAASRSGKKLFLINMCELTKASDRQLLTATLSFLHTFSAIDFIEIETHKKRIPRENENQKNPHKKPKCTPLQKCSNLILTSFPQKKHIFFDRFIRLFASNSFLTNENNTKSERNHQFLRNDAYHRLKFRAIN